MKTIRVLLADDQRMMLDGLCSLLKDVPDIEVVAQAPSGGKALRMIEEEPPDIVLMDISMPGMNGIEAARQVTEKFPNVRVIMLSEHANEVYVLQSLNAGASGYLTKSAGQEELASAIRAVAAGEIYLTPLVSKYVVSSYARRVSGESVVSHGLTKRQREVLQLIVHGHSTQEIAKILVLGVKTVETHRAQLMKRLDIDDIAGLVRYAIRHGLISADE